MEDSDLRQQKLDNQRNLLIRKQQKKRSDTQMVTANPDTRPKNRRQKAASDDTALLLEPSQSQTSLNGSQSDLGLDGVLEEICLGELDLSGQTNRGLTEDDEEIDTRPCPAEANAPGQRGNEGQIEPKNLLGIYSGGDGGGGGQAEEKKPKKKGVKKTQGKQGKAGEEEGEKPKEKKEKKAPKKKEKKNENKTKANQNEEVQMTIQIDSVTEFQIGKDTLSGSDPEEEKIDYSKSPVPPTPKKKPATRARCQLSDNEEDEKMEIVKTPKQPTKKEKSDKSNPSIASLNSNYRETSSDSDHSGRASPLSVEDLEQFALRPAPRDMTIQCRITRDRRGVEKGIFPTYYLHMEKEDGKRVIQKVFSCEQLD